MLGSSGIISATDYNPKGQRQMIQFQSFSSFDDMRAFMAGAEEKAAAQVEDWQREAKPGMYGIIYTEGYFCYLEIIEEEEAPALENYVWMKGYSPFVDGEIESLHICKLDGFLSAEEFRRAKAAGWPQDIFGFARKVLSPGRPAAFLLLQEGSPLLSRDDQQLVYLLVGDTGRARMMSEKRIVEAYGRGNVRWVENWVFGDFPGQQQMIILWHETQRHWEK